jgi:hypothetical protein
VRLFEEEASYCSYGEAYDINCARFGREPDMPIAHFKKRLAAPDGNYDKVRSLQEALASLLSACLHARCSYTFTFILLSSCRETLVTASS